MFEGINIEIDLKNSTISDLHRTITCLLEQTNIKNLNASVHFINQTTDNYETEFTRLEENGIAISSKTTNKRFSVKLRSGEIFSKNFLYKGISFLKENATAFVSPEYSFRRIANSLIITTTVNINRFPTKIDCVIYDNLKIASKKIPSLSTAIINDTCILLKTSQNPFDILYKTLKKEKPSFSNQCYNPLIINNISTQASAINKKSIISSFKSYIKRLCKSNKFINYFFFYRRSDNLDTKTDYIIKKPYISEKIRNELSSLSNINYDYKGFESMRFYDLTTDIDAKINQLFPTYNYICHAINQPHYDYIMILPWIIRGGIDLFAINYLKTISEIYPNKKILVILTDNSRQSLSRTEIGIPDNIDILNLSNIIDNEKESSLTDARLILTSLLINLNPKVIHIMASKLAYDCLIDEPELIRQNANIIFSSYNYLVGEHGDYFGYTVQELPMAYKPGDTITTDNEKSKKLWIEKYGFLENDIYVHKQLFDIDNLPNHTPTTKNGIKILWAAHIRPEKNPEILPAIALALQKDNITIDCYGQFNVDNWEDGKNPIEKGLKNLKYKGPYHDFFKDIDLSQYDLFLYTSHSDGLPNVILEAGIAGLPIVASSIGGIPNAVGKYAYLVKNTHSAEEFISQIHNALLDRDSTVSNAKILQKELKKCHDKKSFTMQVQTMLDRSNYGE